ncbi:N5-carboxyaminoimidazole ribonucleotide synthase [Philodulcilactobacillus myokoensis]|uniref:N5-carboxyaminoimidazole ribonucleotide synthase n=1 Tax=Philodulcilactobacillus myokoensis TaxID=2929573 RepID=A0A9W6ETK2_9LACO|nr:5-(carboxyamino)imidazole ribonucleotide synthase [Philodulcilactobacillus myokoensis]GLB47452.1 N5-carboxyaminoimidazole ribonucleotide synthase [Philodulcilactobacillus myokoensis]
MKISNKPILPPATIGILGGGQLGQMMALSAKYMGYKVGVLDPTPHAPAAQVADFQIVAQYDDVDALTKLAKRSDVLTYEFENVDQDALAKVSSLTEVPQGTRELAITSHRLHEKDFLRSCGVPVTDYADVKTEADLRAAVKKIGMPGIIKTAEGGYDGHGQYDINKESDISTVNLDHREWIYEERQEFTKEASIMVTRDAKGKVIVFPLSENHHWHHILHTSIIPARVDDSVKKQAVSMATKIANALHLTGILGIEFFVMPDGNLMVNELAPRPHNSGHYSIEACNISQFEAHIRSICHLEIPEVHQYQPAVMVNMLGDELTLGRKELPKHPEWHFHDYGKAEIRPRRKMGHITVMGNSIDRLLQSLKQFE